MIFYYEQNHNSVLYVFISYNNDLFHKFNLFVLSFALSNLRTDTNNYPTD